MPKRKQYLNAVEHYQQRINAESFNRFYGDKNAGKRYTALKRMQKRLVADAKKLYR